MINSRTSDYDQRLDVYDMASIFEVVKKYFSVPKNEDWVKCVLFFKIFQSIVERRNWKYPRSAFQNDDTRKELMSKIDGLAIVLDVQKLIDACKDFENDDFHDMYESFTQKGVKDFIEFPIFNPKLTSVHRNYVDMAMEENMPEIEIYNFLFLAFGSFGDEVDIYRKYCDLYHVNSPLGPDEFLSQLRRLRSLCAYHKAKDNGSVQAALGIKILRQDKMEDEYIEDQYIYCRRYIMKDDWKNTTRKPEIQNPVQYIRKCLGIDTQISTGFEVHLNDAIEHFGQVKRPSKFYETLRFSGEKSDAGLECGLFLLEFKKIVDARSDEDPFLLIDPTPAFLDKVEEFNIGGCTTVAVRNEQEKVILSNGYTGFEFYRFDEILNIDRRYAGIAVFERADAPSVLNWAFSRQLTTENTAIVALLPVGRLNTDPQLRRELTETYQKLKIYLLPLKCSTTAPKKKVIISGTQDGQEEPIRIDGIEWALCNGEKYLANMPGPPQGMRKERFWTYLNSKQTLQNFCSKSRNRKGTSTSRASVSKFAFSTEIMISYRVENTATGQKAVAFIQDYPTFKQMKRGSEGKILKGTRTTKMIADDSEVKAWLLNTMPYHSKVQAKIREALYSARKNEGVQQSTNCPWLKDKITLKTVWYLCVRDIDELRKEGFNPELENQKRLMESAVGKIDTGVDLAVIQIEMEKFFEQNALKAEEKELYWRGLNQIFAHAKEEDLCENNPVAEYLRQRKDPVTSNIRKALTKKSFNFDELKELWKILAKEEGGEALSVQIRLMTGLELNVVAGLQWKDLKKLELPESDKKNQEVYQLLISKQVVNNATSCKGFDSKEDYRRIPLVGVLTQKLLQRKNQILELFKVKESSIKGLYICYTNEEIKKILSLNSEKKDMYPSPRKLQTYAKKVIAKLGIEEDVLILPGANKGKKETNLVNYGGDIFKSNFRYYCRRICKMRQEDEDYLAGLQQKTTHGKHYCDFSNDYIQLILFHELERWASGLLEKSDQDTDNVQISSDNGTCHWDSTPVPGACDGAFIVVETKKASTLTVSIQAKGGVSGKMTIEGRG